MATIHEKSPFPMATPLQGLMSTTVPKIPLLCTWIEVYRSHMSGFNPLPVGMDTVNAETGGAGCFAFSTFPFLYSPVCPPPLSSLRYVSVGNIQ